MNNSMIQILGLKKSFSAVHSGIAGILAHKTDKIYAVDDLNFSINRGETLGLIGESGCGKSTTARMILGLLPSDSGSVFVNGIDICQADKKQMRTFRKKAQIVFQDPYEYLNHRMTIREIIAEPLIINYKTMTKQEIDSKVCNLLEDINMTPVKEFINRYPHELSGGQRQRVAIARALILEPDFLVADEPASMLDVSVRADVLNVLRKLKEKMKLTMIYITHDIITAGYMCDRIAVMYKGRIVEIGPYKDVLLNPMHPYTKALVSVVADLDNFLKNQQQIIKDGEIDNLVSIRCCPFERRCPVSSCNCKTCDHVSRPEMVQVGDSHYVYCCCVKKT
jgi:peptide/nickel transport system ATP-binding protein